MTTETINFNQVKRYFKDYSKRNEIDESSSLVDIIKLNKKITKYKRVHVLIFQNSKQEVRIITIENGKKTDKYESLLFDMDNNGQNLMDTNTNDYFNSEKVKAITDLFETNFASDIDFFDMFNDLSEVTITIPLIDNNEINNYFYSAIESKLAKGDKIEVIICGNRYTDSNQENLINKILKLQSKYKFVCHQSVDILPFMCFGQEKGCICLTKEMSISLQNTTKGILHYVVPLTSEHISYIKTLIPTTTECYTIDQKIMNYDIRNKMITLENLLIDVDRIFYEEFGVSLVCPSGLIDRNTFISVPIAKNYNSFSVFLNAVNKTIIEPIKTNSSNAGFKNFLWHGFKNKFPDLQKQLDKIRVFRNKADHSRLDENNEKLYYAYLKEDNDGYLLEFTPNGYQRIQVMWLDNLEGILREIACQSSFNS